MKTCNNNNYDTRDNYINNKNVNDDGDADCNNIDVD